MRALALRWKPASVAARILAATLFLLGGCLTRGDEGAGAETASSATASGEVARAVPRAARVGPASPVRLATTWLVAPAAEQQPPLAVPGAIAVDESRGRVFVLEMQPPEVRLYSSLDGRFVGRLGREGDGPGELRAPMSMALNPRGDLAVVAVDGKVTFWSSDGAHRGASRVGNGLATRIVTAMADSFLVKVDRLPPADVSEYHIVAFGGGSPGARFTDAAVTGLEGPSPPLRSHAYAVAGNAAGELLLALPGPAYRILRISAEGDPVQEIRRLEVAPLVRSDEEVAALRSKIGQRFQSVGRVAPANIPIPRHRSHVAALAVASDGEIWALTRRGGEGGAIIDRFDSHGRFVISYVVPLRVIDLRITERSVYLLGLSDQELPGVAVAVRPGRTRRADDETGGGR